MRRTRGVQNFIASLSSCTRGACLVSIRRYGTAYVRGSEYCILAGLWLVTDVAYFIAFDGLFRSGSLLVCRRAVVLSFEFAFGGSLTREESV